MVGSGNTIFYRTESDSGYDHQLSGSDLKRNWDSLLKTARLNQAEVAEAQRLLVVKIGKLSAGSSETENRQGREVPEWQTDSRASYNQVKEGPAPQAWTNLNRCLHDIYKKATESGGGVSPMTIMAFDGHFFRGQFTAKCNEATLPFAGEVMEYWNSKGASSYPTAAVFTKKGNSLLCIRLWGRPVNVVVPIEQDEDQMPYNDQHFMRELQKWVESQRH
jgi:hypothetical protein